MSDSRAVTMTLAVVFAIILGLFAIIGIPIWASTYYTQKSSCSSWGRETARETKFEVLVQPFGIPVEWDCFTPSGDGRWIPRDRVREFDE